MKDFLGRFLGLQTPSKLKTKKYWVILIVLLAGISVPLIWDYMSLNGEPWRWGAGISAWPSTLFRLLALVTSVILFFVARNQVRSMADNLCDRFNLKIGEGDEMKHSIRSFLKYGWRYPDGTDRTLFRIYYMFNNLIFPKPKTRGKKLVRLSKLWNRWIQDIPAYTLIDVLIGAILLWVVLRLLCVEGNGTLAFRSTISYGIGSAVWALAWWATLTLVLTTFLITRSCYSFIKEMMKGEVRWPKDDSDENVVNRFGKRWNVDGQDVSNLIDVYFVEAWTSKISNLVLYPIASIVFLFVAETAYFDNYGYNPYRYVVLLFMGLLVFAPAFQLRSAARSLRKQKVQRARVRLEFGHCKKADPKYLQRIEKAIQETENLKEGAFEPFLEHPFMQAILFLLGGISLPAFLGMLSRPF